MMLKTVARIQLVFVLSSGTVYHKAKFRQWHTHCFVDEAKICVDDLLAKLALIFNDLSSCGRRTGLCS